MKYIIPIIFIIILVVYGIKHIPFSTDSFYYVEGTICSVSNDSLRVFVSEGDTVVFDMNEDLKGKLAENQFVKIWYYHFTYSRHWNKYGWTITPEGNSIRQLECDNTMILKYRWYRYILPPILLLLIPILIGCFIPIKNDDIPPEEDENVDFDYNEVYPDNPDEPETEYKPLDDNRTNKSN